MAWEPAGLKKGCGRVETYWVGAPLSWSRPDAITIRLDADGEGRESYVQRITLPKKNIGRRRVPG